MLQPLEIAGVEMGKRKALVDIAHHGALASIEYSVRERLNITKFQKSHHNLIYPAMIQAGVHGFISFSSSVQSFSLGVVPADRLILSEEGNYYKVLGELQDLLVDHLMIKSGDREKDIISVYPIAWFLANLLFSLKKDAAIIDVFGVPKIFNKICTFSPYMTLALENFFREIKPVDVMLPVPQFQVATDNVSLLHEVLESNIFKSYSDSHEVVENVRFPDKSVLGNIKTKGKHLHRKFKNSLDMKEVCLEIIPVTNKLVDSFCGKLPTLFVNIFGDILTRFLEKKNNIVIYDYGSVHERIIADYYLALKNSESAS